VYVSVCESGQITLFSPFLASFGQYDNHDLLVSLTYDSKSLQQRSRPWKAWYCWVRWKDL